MTGVVGDGNESEIDVFRHAPFCRSKLLRPRRPPGGVSFGTEVVSHLFDSRDKALDAEFPRRLGRTEDERVPA